MLEELRRVVLICQRNQQRVTYGILGATIRRRLGNPNALYKRVGKATAAQVNALFGRSPEGSWVVSKRNGHPTGYAKDQYDANWNEAKPLHKTPEAFIAWLDKNAEW